MRTITNRNNKKNKPLNVKRSTERHDAVMRLFRLASWEFERTSKAVQHLNKLRDRHFALKEAAGAHLDTFFQQMKTYKPYDTDYILNSAKRKSYKPCDQKRLQAEFIEACELLSHVFND